MIEPVPGLARLALGLLLLDFIYLLTYMWLVASIAVPVYFWFAAFVALPSSASSIKWLDVGLKHWHATSLKVRHINLHLKLAHLTCHSRIWASKSA